MARGTFYPHARTIRLGSMLYKYMKEKTRISYDDPNRAACCLLFSEYMQFSCANFTINFIISLFYEMYIDFLNHHY